jgi:2-(1,2-epoxy-1,2-dihydrophenyl)acetyl-CoA isomerase
MSFILLSTPPLSGSKPGEAMMEARSEHIVATVAEGVGTLLLNRPDALNALSREMVDGLVEHCGRFERDAAVRCVVIRAAGDHFMAGGDVKEFHQAITCNREAHLAEIEQRVVNGHIAISRLRRMEKPVLASIKGAVAGFGIGVAAAADLAIAADDSFFSLAYRHIGLTADAGASYFLPRLVGERRALEMALLGDRYDAKQALEWGFVNWVVPRGSLEEETQRIARRLAEGPTRALGQMKRLLRTSLGTSWDEQSAKEAASIAEMMATDDHLEGVTAFVQKRAPAFEGR